MLGLQLPAGWGIMPFVGSSARPTTGDNQAGSPLRRLGKSCEAFCACRGHHNQRSSYDVLTRQETVKTSATHGTTAGSTYLDTDGGGLRQLPTLRPVQDPVAE